MDTILSIDLDILMTPICGVYNNLVRGDRKKDWEVISERIALDGVSINNLYRQYVQNILSVYAPKVEHIYVGYDHSSILDAIGLSEKKLEKSYKFDLYNIDYHHDVSYDVKQFERTIFEHKPDCGSWVAFLNSIKCLNSYTWYYGLGSSLTPPDFRAPIFTAKLFDEHFPLNLENVKVLYIALSPQWIPPQCDSAIVEVLQPYLDKLLYLEKPYESKKFLDRL